MQRKATVKRHFGIPLADGYAVTDLYCQGANFKKEQCMAHLSPPPSGPFLRPSLFVVTSRYAEWGDVKLLAPLWVEGKAGWQALRMKVVAAFHAASRMDAALRADLQRLQQRAQHTKVA